MTQTVLLAGATGMLGRQVARHLLDQPDTRVRLLVRGGNVAGKRPALDPLLVRGAEIIEGDLADRASLDRATQGVDVIVSAVQGGPDIIIDGQVALAEMGRRNGVRRILPSDYALDLFKATPNEHMMFDLRRTADERIAATGIEHVHVLQGAFMELFGPGMGTIDYDAGTVTFWGDGTQPIEVTSVEGTARMVARVALDRTIESGKFAFAGDRIPIHDAAGVAEAQTGRRFERLGGRPARCDGGSGEGHVQPVQGGDAGVSALHADRPDRAVRSSERSLSRPEARKLRPVCRPDAAPPGGRLNRHPSVRPLQTHLAARWPRTRKESSS